MTFSNIFDSFITLIFISFSIFTISVVSGIFAGSGSIARVCAVTRTDGC